MVVGAGFAGASAARRLADAGRRVLLLERRPHLAGNAFDQHDNAGVLVHRYGPHLFHTGSQRVVEFLSAFTTWHPYQHKVLARHRGELFQMPINRTTLEQFFACELPDAAAATALLEQVRQPQAVVANSEQAVRDRLGDALYQAFFRHYTRKQWQREPSALDASVCRRIPVRLDRDDRYFTHPHQAMPSDGFTAMFQRMLDHPLIEIQTGAVFDPEADCQRAPLTVYTGPLDAFFNHELGELPYRSLRFEHQHRANQGLLQPVATINECDPEVPYTRTTEFRHITGQAHSGTSVVREYPVDHGDPYYPVLDPSSRALVSQYRARAQAIGNVRFVGRLAEFRYFDMDQACAAGLQASQQVIDG